MQLSSFLFTQLPALVANITAAASATTDTAVFTTPLAVKMPAPTQKFTLPPLPYAYNALEPQISEQIMTLHHQKHHQAYVNGLNAAVASHVQALTANDVQAQISLQQAIKFHGGGHINHSLFWPSLCPATSPQADPASAPRLTEALSKRFGSIDRFKSELKAVLLGVQGSGWGWLVKDQEGGLELATTKDQDPVATLAGKKEAVVGVDMWEHAFYLQYYTDKAAYVDSVLNILNWEVMEARFKGTSGALKL